MSSLRTFFVMVLLGLSLSVGTLQAAEPPTREAVQASLDKIADRKLPEADQKALQSVLQSTLTQLNNQRDYEQKLVDLKQQLAHRAQADHREPARTDPPQGQQRGAGGATLCQRVDPAT